MRILYISAHYRGGLGDHAKYLAEKLQEHGFDVELFHAPHIPIKNLKNPSFTLLGSVKAVLNFKEYDIAHAWNVPAAFVMKNIRAKKKILSIHGTYGADIDVIHSGFLSKIGKNAEAQALEIPDVLTTDTRHVQNYYRRNWNLNFEYLPMFLFLQRFEKVPKLAKKKNQVIYVGRDGYEKGIDILREIENRINGNVVYCSNLPWNEAMARLQESAILVVPSRRESMPQVIREAFYLKVPVIAANVGDISNAITSGENGILVEPENPQMLLEETNRLLKDQALQERISKNAHRYILEFGTWESVSAKYFDFYQNLLK